MVIYINGITLEVADCGKELSLENVEKAIIFARQFNPNFSVRLIGGEPLSHSNFFKVLEVLKKNKCDNVAITTDGSLLKEEHLGVLSKFPHATFYITLESVYKSRNDKIKDCAGAFEAGETAIRMLSDMRLPNVSCFIKMMIRKETINEMKDMLIFAQTRRCDGIIFSGEIVSFDSRNSISKECFRHLLQKIYDLQKKYNPQHFFIDSDEPLMRVIGLRGFPCHAGSSFNMTVAGIITFCKFLPIPLDVSSCDSYVNGKLMQAILSRNLKGKCAACPNHYCIAGCLKSLIFTF